MTNVWKTIASALIALVLGAMGTWLSLGNDRPTRVEVRQMIQASAPDISEIRSLRDEIVALKVQQAAMNERIEALLQRLPVRRVD